jgi:hypothetical protein
MPTARQRPCAFIAERERYIDRKTICFKCIRERRGQADVHCWYARRQPQILPAIVTRSDALPLHDVENPGRRIEAPASCLPDKLSCELHVMRALWASSTMRRWWSQTGSNRRPHACKARALPTELWPRAERTLARMFRA